MAPVELPVLPVLEEVPVPDDASAKPVGMSLPMA
jgi:hypothetical protein